jgi:hypothetical protein
MEGMALHSFQSRLLCGKDDYVDFFARGDHLLLERADRGCDRATIDDFCSQSDKHRRFFIAHKSMTTPIFGQWNYDKKQ